MIKEFVESLINNKQTKESIILAEQYQTAYNHLLEESWFSSDKEEILTQNKYYKVTNNRKDPKEYVIAKIDIPKGTHIGNINRGKGGKSYNSKNLFYKYSNESTTPNLGYKIKGDTYEFYTIKDIKQGEHLTINFNDLNNGEDDYKTNSYIKEDIKEIKTEVVLENEELGIELVEEINNIYKKINYLQENIYYKEASFLNSMFNSYSERLKDLFNKIPQDIMDGGMACVKELELLYQEINDLEKANIFIDTAKDYINFYKSSKKFTEEYPSKVLQKSISVLEGVIIRVRMLSVTISISDKDKVLKEGIIRDVVRTVSFKRWRNINKMNKNDYSGFMEDLEEDLYDIDNLKDKERFVNKIKDELEDAEAITKSEDFEKLVLPEYRREFIGYVNFLKRLKSKAEIKKVEK